ncbi:Ferredoxin-NADP reductase [Pseudonocardia ammonioxydans]|uniref:Ferredoxin-NADP reductase n=1 Tax=Pseudonocardia ammonioxydans TaxID=260086 RepID=A0A1I5E5L4_PSUAM|nr:ferredoxin reductase [Pseudonocardia ammonioxydans]SFO06845.1 Ferredoxin-NADP reductase [Pseudonocardia ammonioxydans]
MFRSAPSGRRLLAAVSRLTTPLLPEDFLTLVDPLWSTTSLRGRVVARRRETGRAVSVTIEPGRGWAGHTAGQYVGVGIDVDGVRYRRSYSLSGPEGTDHLTVTVQEVPGGVVSTKLVRDLPIGTVVELEQAGGDFTLPDPLPAKLLFVTAGSGITPVMSMLRTLDRRGTMPDAVLVHSARTPEDTIFAAELAGLAARHPSLRVVLRHTSVTGRLDPAAVDETVPDRAERTVYACGPAALLDALGDAWEGLRAERFTAPARTAEGTGGTVDLGGAPLEVGPGQSLLEAGEAAGRVMPSGCRMGICFGCVLPLREGRVRDLRTGEAHGEPGDLVQTCINSACGPARIELP